MGTAEKLEHVEIVTTVAEYSPTAAALAALKVKFKGAQYEVATTAGMDTAKKDRRELVTLRTTLEAKRKEIKAPALERCNLIDAEAKRITAEILLLETPIDNIIKAEEQRKEAEKAEKARLEAEAQKILDDKIIEIGKLPLRCSGKSAADVELFLATIEAKEIGGEFTGETRTRAEQAKADAVAEIRNIHTVLIEAEAKAEALRLEQEAEVARQAEAKAELDRLKAELEEQQRIREAKEEAFRAEQEAFRAEQKRIDAKKEEAARVEAERLQKVADEEQRIKDEAAAAEREKERLAAIEAEQKALAAEKDRKAAEKARKLAEAKCKTATEAFKKILVLAQNTAALSPTEALAEIAIIAEGNL